MMIREWFKNPHRSPVWLILFMTGVGVVVVVLAMTYLAVILREGVIR